MKRAETNDGTKCLRAGRKDEATGVPFLVGYRFMRCHSWPRLLAIILFIN